MLPIVQISGSRRILPCAHASILVFIFVFIALTNSIPNHADSLRNIYFPLPLSDDIDVSDDPSPACTDTGIFGIKDSPKEFYKCVMEEEFSELRPEGEPKLVVFRKYSFECPASTFFDPVTTNCKEETKSVNYAITATPETSGNPFVMGSIYGQLKSKGNGFCLASTSGNRGHIVTRECNGGKLEHWDRYTDGRIKNAETGKCLESTEDGYVFSAICNGRMSQKWRLDGLKRFANKDSGRCLVTNKVGYVHTGLCGEGMYKEWE